MSRDLRTPLREALIAHLRADATVVALVPALQIYGERVPANRKKPYIAPSRMSIEAFNATCIKGGRIPINLNVFADGEDSGVINAISAAVVASLDDAQLELDGGWCLDLTYVRTTAVPQTESTHWQDRITFEALTGVGD